MSDVPMPAATPAQVDSFISRWQSAQAAEKSNGQLFLAQIGVLSRIRP